MDAHNRPKPHHPAKLTPWSKQDTGLLLLYLLLAVLLTWPTILHLFSHLPGDGGDDPALGWNMWWVKYALLNLEQNPFTSDFIFYPLGINLAYYTLTVLNAVTALPLTLNIGVVAATNLHTLLSFVLAGYGTNLLVRYLFARTNVSGDNAWLCAAIAGGFYAFATNKLFYVALGQFNIASTHWIPFTVLYVVRMHDHPRAIKNGAMAALFLGFMAWTELTYASFLLIFCALYWLYRLLLEIRHKPASGIWAALKPHLVTVLLFGLLFIVLLSPILAYLLPDMVSEGDFLVEGSGFAEAFSADLLGFVIPTIHHPWLGHLVEQSNIANYTLGQHIYVGLVLLSLATITAIFCYKNPTVRFWLVATVVFGLLCLGPMITIDGIALPGKGPFVILQQLPFFKGNRYPSRFSVMLLLSLSVLAAFALLQLSVWLQRYRPWSRILLAIITILFLFEHLAVPLPQSDMRPPAPYQTIAATPGDFTLLDIPFAWRNGFRVTGALTTQIMFGQFYQALHQKRLLQGNTSRNPALKFQYFTQAPLINTLLALETGKTVPAEQWAHDRAIAGDVLRFFNIKYIVVRTTANADPAVTPQNTIPYIEDVLPVEKISETETAGGKTVLYQVIEQPAQNCLNTPAGTLQLTTNCPLAPLFFGEGWGLLTPGQPIAAQRRQARLMLPFAPGFRRITIRARTPKNVSVPDQTISVAINGWQSPPQPLSPAWQAYQFTVPADVIQPGLNDVMLHFAQVAQLPAVEDGTPLVDITVLSAGEEVGGFGHIFMNGHDLSPNQRGYNVVILPPAGQPQAGVFDTHLDAAASLALENFLTAAPPDAIIALAAADEASASLSESAAQTIQQVTGATSNGRDCFRCSQAIIGGRLDQPVLESINQLQPVGLTTNLGLTEPGVAAIIDQVIIE